MKRVTGEEDILDSAKADLFPSNEKDLTTADHCSLIHLNEPCILENTRLRHCNDQIYTYTGKILVALNPFGPLKIMCVNAMKNILWLLPVGHKKNACRRQGSLAHRHLRMKWTPCVLSSPRHRWRRCRGSGHRWLHTRVADGCAARPKIAARKMGAPSVPRSDPAIRDAAGAQI